MRPGRSYLELGQFLDLERRWNDAADELELCHRICKTAALLLDTPTVAIFLAGSQGEPAQRVAGEGDWQATAEVALAETMAGRAIAARLPQVKSVGDVTIGVFPFHLGDGRSGCVAVRVSRPLLEGAEVAFLRFLASLTAVFVSGERIRSDQEPSPKKSTDGDAREQARRYVAMAVHDLRNPLNVLSGYAGLLADESLGPLNEDQRRAAQAMCRQVGVLADAIDQLIDLDRIASSAATVESTAFVLSELFAEIRERCFTHLQEEIDWPREEAAFEVVTDRRRLGAIIQNLVDNALRHGGGEQVRIECTREHGHLIVRVCDRGTGLTPQLRRALSAWLAGEEPEETPAGLGLRIVAENVRVLGGRLVVADRDGGGTIMELRLPPAQERREG